MATMNNGIPIMHARFGGRCKHCGARIQPGRAIIKSSKGWIHARCPKDIPFAPEQEALHTPFNRDEWDTPAPVTIQEAGRFGSYSIPKVV